MPHCNSTLEQLTTKNETPLWKEFTFHDLGLILCAVFGLIATCIGAFLISAHATHYLKPYEQKHIIRILLLIPVYSVVSFLSYVFYHHAIYYDILEGLYEAFAISSFFTLLCHYIAPNLHDQKEYFRTLKPKNWFWGVFGLQYITGGQNKGPFRKPRSGLTWFNIIWIGVFQYCFIRVLFTIVSVLAQIGNVYCEDSLSPAFAHVWVEAFESLSVTVAMFCLIQFYIQLKGDLAEHRPFLKILCIKLVIFFSFWQTIIISFLSSSNGPLKPTARIAYPDIKVGIPSTLLCIEMAIFAVMHIFAFPWKPYLIKKSYLNPDDPAEDFSGENLKYKGVLFALFDSFNPWDIIKSTARGFKWLFVGYKKRQDDPSYQTAAKVAPGYEGPTFAGNRDTATELQRTGNDDQFARGRSDTTTTDAADDRAGLLAHQARSGRMPSASPYRPYESVSADDSQIDLGRPPRQPPLPGTATTTYEDFGDTKTQDFDDDTAYRPGASSAAAGAGAGAGGLGGGVHPMFRRSNGVEGRDFQGHQWDMFSGVQGQGQGQQRPGDYAESMGRPPTYRTGDPYG